MVIRMMIGIFVIAIAATFFITGPKGTPISVMESPPPQSAGVDQAPDGSVDPLRAITGGVEVMEDAKAVQEMLDARTKDMDQSLNDIR